MGLPRCRRRQTSVVPDLQRDKRRIPLPEIRPALSRLQFPSFARIPTPKVTLIQDWDKTFAKFVRYMPSYERSLSQGRFVGKKMFSLTKTIFYVFAFISLSYLTMLLAYVAGNNLDTWSLGLSMFIASLLVTFYQHFRRRYRQAITGYSTALLGGLGYEYLDLFNQDSNYCFNSWYCFRCRIYVMDTAESFPWRTERKMVRS